MSSYTKQLPTDWQCWRPEAELIRVLTLLLLPAKTNFILLKQMGGSQGDPDTLLKGEWISYMPGYLFAYLSLYMSFHSKEVGLLWRQSTAVWNCSWTTIHSCLFFQPFHAHSKTLQQKSSLRAVSICPTNSITRRHLSHRQSFEYSCRLLDGSRKPPEEMASALSISVQLSLL